MRELYITNSLSRSKELFKPINEGHVGLYVCGPTVYGDAARKISTAATPYASLYLPQAALGNVPASITLRMIWYYNTFPHKKQCFRQEKIRDREKSFNNFSNQPSLESFLNFSM